MTESCPDVWVYRDGKRREPTAESLRLVVRSLERLETRRTARREPLSALRREAVEALVVCGELESAVADLGDAAPVEQATDALAALALGDASDLGPVLRDLERLASDLESTSTARLEGTLTMSSPEGFAYYGLHPEACAFALASVSLRKEVLVVGVRSIGTTLSAVALAALRKRGVAARRITVRPAGPTADRHLASVPAVAPDTTIIIADEGPGLSGSTFLATAEAFVRAGARAEDVMLLATRAPDLERLQARDVARRWTYVTLVATGGLHAPPGRNLGGGEWRRLHELHAWPPVANERAKVLGLDRRLWKLEGLGLGAQRAFRRARALASEGFVPALRDEGDGWWSSPWAGRPLEPRDVETASIDHVAHYLARRVDLLSAPAHVTDLAPVVAKNAAVLRPGSTLPALPVVRPAIVDGRMHLHEWLRSGAYWLKTDAASHGDDHFFPGPTDVAWDVAGTIVEWRLDGPARARLLDTYRRLTGDDVSARIDAWIFAYATTRWAYSAFARAYLCDGSEHERFTRAIAEYRAVLDAPSTSIA